MYFKPETQTAFATHSEIRAAHPDVSFPATITDESLEAHGIYPVLLKNPTHDPITQAVREIAPVLTDKGHWEQQWEVVTLDAEAIAANQAAASAAQRQAAKAARALAVENIKVTTSAGNTFDGDEASQARMSRAILLLSAGIAPSVPWVLADNTVIQATAAELTEALALAGAEQARLWVLPS